MRWFSIAFVLLVAAPIRAQSQTPSESSVEGWASTSLHWTRDESAPDCVSEAELRGAVETQLDARLPVEAARSVRGEARRDGAHVTLTLSLYEGEEPQGRRVLERDVESCRALDTALALAIALMVDPERAMEVASRISPTSAPEPSPIPRAAVPAVAPTLSESPDEPERPVIAGGLRLELWGTIGALPEPAIGGRLAVFVELAPWIAIEGRGHALGEVGVSDDASRGSDVWMIGGGAGLSFTLPLLSPWLDGALALALDLSELRARGRGLDETRDASALIMDVSLGASLLVRPIPEFFLGLTVMGAVSPIRPRVVYRAPDGSTPTLWQRPAVSGGVSSFVGVRFSS